MRSCGFFEWLPRDVRGVAAPCVDGGFSLPFVATGIGGWGDAVRIGAAGAVCWCAGCRVGCGFGGATVVSRDSHQGGHGFGHPVHGRVFGGRRASERGADAGFVGPLPFRQHPWGIESGPRDSLRHRVGCFAGFGGLSKASIADALGPDRGSGAGHPCGLGRGGADCVFGADDDRVLAGGGGDHAAGLADRACCDGVSAL